MSNGITTGRPNNWRELMGRPWIPVCANYCRWPFPFVKKEGDACTTCKEKEGGCPGTKS